MLRILIEINGQPRHDPRNGFWGGMEPGYQSPSKTVEEWREMTTSEADRIKAIVERLVHKPTTD